MKALFADEWRENSLALISSATSGLRNNEIATWCCWTAAAESPKASS